jgi:putative ABC transport system permease protein
VRLVRLAWRESRAGRGRLLLSVAGIAVGVAALVAVQAFASALRTEARDQARTLLGADLSVQSRQPFGPRVDALLDTLHAGGRGGARPGATSMARLEHGDFARLVRVRAADAAYPFYGRPDARPADAWAALGQGRRVLVEPGLLLALDGADRVTRWSFG